MRTELFQSETVGVANTIGRAEHKVSVVFAGEQAATDGNRIFLPALPSGEMSTHQADVMRGFVDHEGLHVRYTDMAAYAADGKPPSKMLHSLANAIEDMRIEALGIAEYPGMRHNISATATEMNANTIEALREHATAGTVNKRIWGSVAITWAGRLAQGMAVASNEQMLALCPPELRDWANRVVAAVPGLKSTRDVVALAKQLIEEIKEEAKQQQKQQGQAGGQGEPGDGDSQASGQQQDDGSQGQGSGTGNGKGETDANANAPGQGGGNTGKDVAGGQSDQPDQSGQPTPPQGGGEGSNSAGDEAGAPFDESQMLAADFKDAVTSLANDLRANAGKDGQPYSLRLTNECDRIVRISDRTAKGYAQRHAETMAAIGPALSTMRRKLERMIVARQLDEWQGGHRNGRLDQRRLSAAALGQHEVYRQRFEAPALDTALLLLCDLSDSMKGRRIALVEELVIALSDSLERLGAPFAVYGYAMEALSPKVMDRVLTRPDGTMGGVPRGVTMPHALRLDEFKTFGDSLRLVTTRGRIAHMHQTPDGGTPTGESMMLAAPILLARRERRRIMLVLTDGASSNQAYCNHVSKMLSAKCEVVGIGIGTDTVRRGFPRYIVVQDLAGFISEGMDLVGKLLLGDRVRLSAA